MLATAPRTAADLCRALEMSRPTMSHHVHALREAGLLDELREGGGVLLTLRREVLEQLSAATISKLFAPHDAAVRPRSRKLTTTRRRS